MPNSLLENDERCFSEENSTAPHPRTGWTPPRVRRLLAGEAELGSSGTTDAEGLS